jgi:hypothetical protein
MGRLMGGNMARTYSLQGPISLDNLSNTGALAFLTAVINAIPSYSMGTASMNVRAQGPAGSSVCTVEGTTVDALKASLQAVPTAAEDIIYDVMGRVNLVGLSFEDGIEVVNAVINAIPPDSLVATALLAQEEVQSS